MKNSRIDHLFDYPFQKLAVLLEGTDPAAGLKPLLMHLGEPQLPQPSFSDASLADHSHLWNKYPSARGTADFRDAAGGWLARREQASTPRVVRRGDGLKGRHSSGRL